MEAARATGPQGLHGFVVGRSEGPSLLLARAHTKSDDTEEPSLHTRRYNFKCPISHSTVRFFQRSARRRFKAVESSSLFLSLPLRTGRSLHQAWGKKELPV
jgi:hypothetical protein